MTMKRLLLAFAFACVAACNYPQETKMEAVEPTDAQTQNDPNAKPKKTN
jgi:uncharacterized lipoprotein YajG